MVPTDASVPQSAGALHDAEALLERLLGLWTNPVDDEEEMTQRFLALYTDPVRINGVDTAVVDLVERARLISTGLAEVRREVVDVLAVPGRVAFGFRLIGRHVGPLPTPLGPVPPSGAQLDILGIDLLQLDEEGRIAGITVLSGLMDVLATTGALQLRGS